MARYVCEHSHADYVHVLGCAALLHVPLQQLKVVFSLYKHGQSLSCGDLIGRVTSKNAHVGRVFPVEK